MDKSKNPVEWLNEHWNFFASVFLLRKITHSSNRIHTVVSVHWKLPTFATVSSNSFFKCIFKRCPSRTTIAKYKHQHQHQHRIDGIRNIHTARHRAYHRFDHNQLLKFTHLRASEKSGNIFKLFVSPSRRCASVCTYNKESVAKQINK